MIYFDEITPEEDIFDLGSYYIVVRNEIPYTVIWEGKDAIQAQAHLKIVSNKDKMIVIFHKNAAELYTKEETINGRFFGNGEWRETIRSLEGKVRVVKTEYLWNNAFNTEIKPYTSNDGLRVTGEEFDSYLMEHIINDKRIGRGICNWCHKPSLIDEGCGKHRPRYFKPFEVNKK